jgi:hypothetical protein
MRREMGSMNDVRLDSLIELIGEIGQEGIDALADLLIAAARRDLQEDDGNEMQVEEHDAP